MSIQLAPVLRQRFSNADGDPLAGGKLYSYRAGTSTPLSTYTDNTGLTPNANPTILNANGEAPVWVDTNSFKFVLTDANDVVQWTSDNVTAAGVGATGAAGSQIYTGAGVPSNGLGVNGDFYVDTTGNNTYYTKAGTTWSSQANLKGATGSTGSTGSAGAAGSQIYSGSGAPSGGLGVNGDFYFDTSGSNTVYQKSAGSWSSLANLKGATGATGSTGSTGSAGTNGTNGTNGSNGLLGGYPYLFSTATSSTPTTSTLNFDNATIPSVTNVYINKTDLSPIAIGGLLVGLTTGCKIQVSDVAGNAAIFAVGGSASLSGNVYTIPVSWVGNTGTLTNGSTVSLTIQQIGATGSTGPTGATGPTGPTGATGASFAYVSQSSTLNPAVIGDFYLLSGASFNITLPTAASIAGQTVAFKHNGTSLTQVYTFLTTSAQTIDGVASGSYQLWTNSESLVLISDGSNWQVLEHKTNSNWSAYTPTFVGFGTVASVNIQWRRFGMNCEVMGSFTTGTVTATTASMTLPGSITNLVTAINNVYGYFYKNIATVGAPKSGTVIGTAAAANTLGFQSLDTGGGGNPIVPNTGSNVAANGQQWMLDFSVPITGWQP